MAWFLHESMINALDQYNYQYDEKDTTLRWHPDQRWKEARNLQSNNYHHHQKQQVEPLPKCQ